MISTLFLKIGGAVFADSQPPQSLQQIESKKIDRQAEILTNYLAKFNSPLQYHAQDFVDAANTYQVDWKLVTAIAGVESTFGKFIPGGYNAWGWGVYGTQAIYFNSWREGVFTVTKGLKENYIDKGLTDPFAMNKIYAQSKTWGSRVAFFIEDLKKFEEEYIKQNPLKVEVDTDTNTAANSGKLASK